MAIGKYFVLILPSINIELFIGGLSGLSSQILADHLTLSQPGVADYYRHDYYRHPRIFRPSYGPEYVNCLFKKDMSFKGG